MVGVLANARFARRANLPVFESLYKSVKDGSETRRSLEFNGRKTYREDLQKELDEIDQQEVWRAGKTVRSLRVRLFPLIGLSCCLSKIGELSVC